MTESPVLSIELVRANGLKVPLDVPLPPEPSRYLLLWLHAALVENLAVETAKTAAAIDAARVVGLQRLQKEIATKIEAMPANASA